MEYFLRIRCVAAQSRSQKFTVEIGARHQRFLQEGSSSCRCSTTSLVDQETMKKNASQMLNSFLYVQKDLE